MKYVSLLTTIFLTTILTACPGPLTDYGEVPDPAGLNQQEPVPTTVHPTCLIGDKTATTRSEALRQWGEPCSRDLFSDVETWQYAVTRCRLDTGSGPLDDFCPMTCGSTSARYKVTFTRDVVSGCETPDLETPVTFPTYKVTRYAHHDPNTTSFGARCPGSTVLVGGLCDCDGSGLVLNSQFGDTRLDLMQCECSSPGVSIYISCLSTDVPGTVVDATP